MILIPMKMACIELCEGVDIVQRQTPTQILMLPFSRISLGVGFCLGVGKCECTISRERKTVKLAPHGYHTVYTVMGGILSKEGWVSA